DGGRPGAVVNIVLDIWRGSPQMAHSCASRAGGIYLSRTLAVEWAQYGIRVNCIAPGLIESSGFEHYPESARRSFHRANPMLRVGSPPGVDEACCYLLSPAASFITGEVLTIDGGQQLWGELWPAGRPAWFGPETDAGPSHPVRDQGKLSQE